MALVQQNLVPATGDHLVTLDTETNLEWLSLNATANLSYLEVLGGAGGYTTTYGFRYASGQEIGLLWQHAGITKYGVTQVVPFPHSNHVAMETLIELMGGAALYPSITSGSVLVQTQGMMKFRGAGVPTPITPMSVGGFAALRALSTRNDEPELASRPWDNDRDGFVVGEDVFHLDDAVVLE